MVNDMEVDCGVKTVSAKARGGEGQRSQRIELDAPAENDNVGTAMMQWVAGLSSNREVGEGPVEGRHSGNVQLS